MPKFMWKDKEYDFTVSLGDHRETKVTIVQLFDGAEYDGKLVYETVYDDRCREGEFLLPQHHKTRVALEESGMATFTGEGVLRNGYLYWKFHVGKPVMDRTEMKSFTGYFILDTTKGIDNDAKAIGFYMTRNHEGDELYARSMTVTY